MKTVKVNNSKDYFKEIHKMQRGYKNETWADGGGFVYRDGKCVGRVVLVK